MKRSSIQTGMLGIRLGLAGEELVLHAERLRLVDAGRPDLADAVVHVSVVEGDGAGYDIGSFSEDGEVRYLEVKTTRSGATSAFFVSPNESRSVRPIRRRSSSCGSSVTTGHQRAAPAIEHPGP